MLYLVLGLGLLDYGSHMALEWRGRVMNSSK
jgi:hypothetical protein